VRYVCTGERGGEEEGMREREGEGDGFFDSVLL
jgi:hypothetical protein